ncbi:hypothetical protein CTA1_13150 [Colletotrichum tanaceti]|uniref:Uncharacterized protein n=1 Tax=Colletotrichum tanaceti TaxID=1306861 RepID=A0A4U6X8A8_9PEZI|nr:hypothetical protein CTA1_13150 [Colletotrichum tanaceti]
MIVCVFTLTHKHPETLATPTSQPRVLLILGLSQPVSYPSCHPSSPPSPPCRNTVSSPSSPNLLARGVLATLAHPTATADASLSEYQLLATSFAQRLHAS